MTPDGPDRHGEQDQTVHVHKQEEEAQATVRITKDELGPLHEPEEAEEPKKKGLIQGIRGAYRRARDGRNRAADTPKRDRSAKSKDRSKVLLALAVSVIVMLFVLVGMFSHSTKNKATEAKRNTPSLGRPEVEANAAAENRGSVTPLQTADMTAQEGNGDQISPDDVNNTARMRLRQGAQTRTTPTLASVPPMGDPALEAYRQARERYVTPPTPPIPHVGSAPAPAPARNEAEGLKKSSLVFVRNSVNGSTGTIRRTSISTEPVLLEREVSGLLPRGSRLVARMQSAASTAVKAPVVAAIEYNYERDGEIIIPAGTKAFGELQQANRSGIVSVRFHTLQMPDGTTDKIDGTAMSLTYGPLKGNVTGSNRGKRILVRSLTGVGTMAAYLVGGPGGFSGTNGQLNNSILLRERIASNAGLAGEQELMSLAMNEQIVVTVPANTRFFIVLQDSGRDRSPSKLIPTGTQATTQHAAGGNSLFPTAQELRELIELKIELNRMHREVVTTRTSEPVTSSPQQQE